MTAAGDALLPLRGQHSLAPKRRRCFPFHRRPGANPIRRNRRRGQCSSGPIAALRPAARQCYHSRMLDQLDALAGRMRELVAHVRQLRDENHQLRTQLATSQAELAALNERIETATRRLDELIARLPQDAGAPPP